MSIREALPGGASERISFAELLAFSDEQLLHEMRAGNTDAFAVIFKRYYRLVHVLALRVLRDTGEAEDLVQNVFLEVYRQVGQIDPARGTFKVWLLQRTQSRSVNRRNYLLVRQFHNQVELAAVETEQGPWSPKHAAVQETKHVTKEVLEALPEAQRETIALHFFEGLSLKEIAERRDETFSNVRHHYYRGLARLRAYFEHGIRRESRGSSMIPSGEG